MPLPTTYSTGTASVADGATTLTIVGAVSNAIYAGDFFMDPAQPLVPPQRIASVTGGGVYELAVGWPGTAMTSDPYEVRFTNDAIRMSERTRQLLEQMSVVEANGRGLFYLFATATADADPGAGYLRLNNATPGSATAAYLDNSDANGAAVQTILDTWDDSGASGGRGQLWVRSVADPATFHSFTVTGAVVDGTGYRKVTLTYIGGSGSLNADDELMVDFVPVGPAGAAGAAGSNGTNGTNGTNGVDGKLSGTEVIKTAAYTALAADVGKTIILNKATADTLSFDPAATLGSTWMVMVKNIGAGTWVLDPNGAETIDGSATISLRQNQSMVVASNGTALRSFFLSSTGRELLTANRTYYVRKDGSDSNDGLADTAGGAFLTIQKAVDIVGGLDLSIYNVTITVRADGGTPYASVILKTLVGAGSVTISGDTTTPSNVGITTSTASTDAVNADGIKGSWTLEGVKFTTTGSGRHGVNVTNSRVNFGVVDFGACISNQLSVSQAGLAVFNANYSVTGSAAIHWDARIGSIIQCVGRTITITGTPAFSTAFCSATRLSMANVPSNTFSGSATGTRYTGTENSVVYVGGGGATYLPGNAAGSTATGGQYV